MMRRRHTSTPQAIGRRIRERREALELKQEQLAAMAGITQPTLSSIERGATKNPEAGTILSIAAALKTSPYLLVYEHMPPSAMEHTVAALVGVWDRLTDRQRLQVLAYAQGLLDAGAAGNQERKGPPTHPPKPANPNGGSSSH